MWSLFKKKNMTIIWDFRLIVGLVQTHLPYSKAWLLEAAAPRPREFKPCCRKDGENHYPGYLGSKTQHVQQIYIRIRVDPLVYFWKWNLELLLYHLKVSKNIFTLNSINYIFHWHILMNLRSYGNWKQIRGKSTMNMVGIYPICHQYGLLV